MNINAPNEDNLCFIKNVLEQGATLIDSPWLFFSFSQVGELAHTHTHSVMHTHTQTEVYSFESSASFFLCGETFPFKCKVSRMTIQTI